MIYLLVLLVLLGCMVLCDARGKLMIFRHPVRALTCLTLGTGFFVLWDVVAIRQGIFLHRDSPLMTGVMLGDQFPLEELFFLLFLCYSSMIVVTGTPVLAAWLRTTRSGKGSTHVS